MDSETSVFTMPENVPEHLKPNLTETLQRMEQFVKTRKGGKHYKWSLEDFDIGRPLGRGKFGRVYLSRDRHSHNLFALKLMHKSEIVQNNVERQVLREIEIQCNLKHPNILSLRTYFEDERFTYLVLEYAAQGELYKHLKASPNGRFPDEKAAKYLYQVADALHYCHLKKVIHRDIKPENILLSHSDNVKLSDFGWSVHAPSAPRKTMCGTLDYLPPEMVLHKSYDANVDNWCLGVLLFEFLTGSPPFESPSTNATYARIQNLQYTVPPYVTTKAKELINKLLRLNPADRISLEGILHHPWILEKYPQNVLSTSTRSTT